MTPVTSCIAAGADQHEDRQPADHPRDRAGRRPLEQLRVDRPQLDQQQRDRRQARGHVQPLGEPVQPRRGRRPDEPAGRVLDRWLISPVTKQMAKATPSHSPTRADRRSECSGLVNAPSRNGPRRSASGRPGHAGAEQPVQRAAHAGLPTASATEATTRAVRLPGGHCAATARASGKWSMSVSSGRSSTSSPIASSASRVRTAVSVARHGDVGQHRGGVGGVQAEGPPAAVRGGAEDGRAGTAELEPLGAPDQQVGGHLRGVHADEQGGRGRAGHGVGERGGQPGAEVALDLRARRRSRRGPGRPARRRAPRPAGRPGPRAPRRGCRPPRRRRCRPPARGVHGGVSRVLLRPGTGALVMTRTWVRAAGHRASTPRMSRIVRTVPRTVPVTLDFEPSVRSAVVDVDLADAPAGVGRGGHHLQRVAEPAVGERRARAAPRGGRRASGPGRAAAARCAGAACAPARGWRPGRAPARRRGTGGAGRAPGRRPRPAPGRRPAAAGRGPSSRRRRRSTRRPRWRPQEPGVRGGTEAALRHADDGRAVLGRDRRPSRRSSRCPRRSPGSRPAAGESTHGSDAASSRQGRTTSTGGACAESSTTSVRHRTPNRFAARHRRCRPPTLRRVTSAPPHADPAPTTPARSRAVARAGRRRGRGRACWPSGCGAGRSPGTAATCTCATATSSAAPSTSCCPPGSCCRWRWPPRSCSGDRRWPAGCAGGRCSPRAPPGPPAWAVALAVNGGWDALAAAHGHRARVRRRRRPGRRPGHLPVHLRRLGAGGLRRSVGHPRVRAPAGRPAGLRAPRPARPRRRRAGRRRCASPAARSPCRPCWSPSAWSPTRPPPAPWRPSPSSLPGAVWIATSADALFAGVTAWGVALLALAAARAPSRTGGRAGAGRRPGARAGPVPVLRADRRRAAGADRRARAVVAAGLGRGACGCSRSPRVGVVLVAALFTAGRLLVVRGLRGGRAAGASTAPPTPTARRSRPGSWPATSPPPPWRPDRRSSPGWPASAGGWRCCRWPRSRGC